MKTSASHPLLEVLSGPCRGARAPLGRAVCMIGDDDGCDLLLGPPRSSNKGSRYASLRADADGVWLARPDDGGATATETRLAHGDEFEVAGVRCRIICEGGTRAHDDGASVGGEAPRDAAPSMADTVSLTDAYGQETDGTAYDDASGSRARGTAGLATRHASALVTGSTTHLATHLTTHPAPGLATDLATDSVTGLATDRATDSATDSATDLAVDFAAALDRAGVATSVGRDPAVSSGDGVRPAASEKGGAVGPARARLRRRAVLSTLVLIAGLLVGGALTDGPLFAMQGRAAAPMVSGAAASETMASASAAAQLAAEAVHAQLARAGVARWVGVAHEGATLHLVVFADAPAHESTIRQALSNAGIALPVRVVNESTMLAQVNAFLQEENTGPDTPAAGPLPAPAARPRTDRLRAVGAGPGRLRLVGMVDTRADAAAAAASVHARFPALKAIECDPASDVDARQIVSPLLREPLSGAGPDAAPRVVAAMAPDGAPADHAFDEESPGIRVLIDAAPAMVAAIGRRIAAAAAAQNQMLAVALPLPTGTDRHAPAPRMIVMGPRPYAVLADGATVFEGDVLGDRVVARIERDAIRLLPPPGSPA